MQASALFHENANCWRSSYASHGTPLVDCEHYYRALYHAILAARESIFIAGWDIDSRIALLQGEEAETAETPVVISDLLAWKAEQNPELQMFLLRWDSSLAFFSSRELWAKEVWEEKTPANVHICLDDTIPMGGSQHQKIVVVDDQLVFTGGMDVAVSRWDTRDHLPHDPRRDDPDGPYGPLHDVQVMVCGPVVQEYAKLLRWRWQRATDTESLPLGSPAIQGELPPCWPRQYPPLLEDIPCAIARTIPFMDDVDPVQEVRHMLLDLIEQAEHFIYIENQFASREEIAEALNRRMKQKPELKVLIVSSYDPKGTMECEAYWAGRIDFKAILEQGLDSHRVVLTHSSMLDDQGERALKRVHSKVMTIDDRYLVIGSSNLSNRSMALDTECDLIFAGDTEAHRESIRRVRDDLIAEHTGRDIAEVSRLIAGDHPLEDLMQCDDPHRYHLEEVNDEAFTDKSWQDVLTPLSDPEEPLVPPLSVPGARPISVPNPRKKSLIIGSAVLLFLLLAGAILAANHYFSWFNSDNLSQFLEESRNTQFALPSVLAVYVIGGLFFFPVTVMSLAVAAVFGPVWGPVYGMAGALCSAWLMFLLGKIIGDRGLRKLGGPRVRKVDEKFTNSGVAGVATIRLIPVAPYSLVNLVAGISSIRLLPFLLGTFLGMLPPIIAKGLVGDSLSQLATDPSAESISYLTLGILIWVAVIMVSQKVAKNLQADKTAA